jgi:hypothetical protein
MTSEKAMNIERPTPETKGREKTIEKFQSKKKKDNRLSCLSSSVVYDNLLTT